MLTESVDAPRVRRRVLVVSPFVPSVNGVHGSSRVTGGLLSAIADRHEVGLVYLRGSGEDPLEDRLAGRLAFVAEVHQADARSRRLRRTRILVGLLRGRPMWVQDVWSAHLRDAIAQAISSFRPDVVQIELAVTAPALKCVPGGVATVLVDYDPAVPSALERVRAHRGSRRLLHALDALAWRRTTRTALRRVDVAVVFTDRDRRQLASLARDTPVRVVALGVDIPPSPMDPAGDDGFVLFVGSARHPPNADAAERLVSDILPRILRKNPTTTLHIVGDHRLDRVPREVGARCVLEGHVESVDRLLNQAAVVVAPLRLGGGMRVKVLEAVAAGKAVVASPVAAAGLEAMIVDDALVVADGDEAFSDAVVALLRERDRRVAIAKRARAYAIENLSWRARVAAYEQTWTAAVDRRGRRQKTPVVEPTRRQRDGETQLVRQLSWRFLLPRHGAIDFQHAVLLGATAEMQRSAQALGLATRVTTEPDVADPADLVAVLAPCGDIATANVVGMIRPGGVVYWQVDRRRRGQRLLTPRRLASRLDACGLRVTQAYALLPDVERNDIHLPIDHAAGVRWYLSSVYCASSALQRLTQVMARLVARVDYRSIGRGAPFHAVIAVRLPEDSTSRTIAQQGCTMAIGTSSTLSPLLIHKSTNRAVCLVFPDSDERGGPVAVVKIPTRPNFSARTMSEYEIVQRIRATLDERDRKTIPTPFGLADVGLAWPVAVEQGVSGRLLASSSESWGRPLFKKARDLALAEQWIAQFHVRHQIAARKWDEPTCRDEVDGVFATFEETFGTTMGEDRLFAHARRTARELIGSSLPLVWQHGDFTVWNTARTGGELRVLDWEGARPGLPLCDLLRFVTHWHEVARGARTLDSRMVAFRQLFCEAPPRGHATQYARTALDRYVTSVAIDPHFESVLLVTSWAELALRRAVQQRDSDIRLCDSRDDNEAIAYLAELASARD